MSQWPHLASFPDSFEDFADVIFVVSEQRLPAHSYYLASHSKILQNVMRECPTFSKDAPLVLDRQLGGFAASELQTFLNQIYFSPVISSVAEAQDLLKVADLFDAATLLGKAVAYLEETPAQDLFVSSSKLLDWMLFAERCNFTSFMKRCAAHAAIAYEDISKDARFGSVGPCALRAVMHGLHQLTDIHPGVVMLDGHFDPVGTKAARFAVPEVPSVTAGQLFCRQIYMCKASKLMSSFAGHHLCGGHSGSWNWNLQKQVWQLTSNPRVMTKALPGNVLELANLLGSLPIHKSNPRESMCW